jgi:hypothetical protein
MKSWESEDIKPGKEGARIFEILSNALDGA